MSDADVLGWHRGIFLTTFAHQAGEIRTGATQFGIRWRDGEELRIRMATGSDPARIREELRVVLRDYNAELGRRESERRSVGDAARTAATVYAEILRIHPFEDGNLRAAFPALQCALVSLGVSPVDFETAVPAHDEALGWALRPDEERRTVIPFAELILSRIRAAGQDRRGGVELDSL
jgi:fido (protein-threonine AMPylation protein)